MAIRSWIHSPTGHLRTLWTGNHVINGTSTHNICSKVSILHINPTIDIIECAGRNLGFQGPPWNLITIIEAKLRERGVRVGMRLIACPSFFFVLWRMLLDNEKRSIHLSIGLQEHSGVRSAMNIILHHDCDDSGDCWVIHGPTSTHLGELTRSMSVCWKALISQTALSSWHVRS